MVLSATGFNLVIGNRQSQPTAKSTNNQEIAKRKEKEAPATNPFDHSPEELSAKMAALTKAQPATSVETAGTLAFSGAETAGTMASAGSAPSASPSSSSGGGSVCAVA